ncbi:hypothetical protein niasHS_009995 [Heterodera schachtii]|uniref:PIPK domain-containing protein n=1 Tax=Heterodera schachtii TaxID=97005 RepID=A0ABD2JD47_HETSC
MFLLAIVLAFSLQFLSSVADPENQLGFKCTNVSNSQNYGCLVKGNVLRFFVIGDIGGEEYTVEDEQQQCTVEGHVTVADCVKNNCPTVVKHRPTEAQKAVAKAMHSLATSGKTALNFLLNVGDNFYEKGVTNDDVKERFEENFTKVYHQDSLKVPWYTIAGNDDWKSTDGIKPQIDYPTDQWTFPAQNYVVNYEFGESPDKRKTAARFIMIDTTVLCGSGATVFGKMKKKEKKEDTQKYAKMIEDAKTHFKWLRKELREAKRRGVHFLFLAGHHPLHILDDLPGARLYPCARRVMALMRFFQVQAYFAGHEHNLKHADLSSSKHQIRTQYIVSGAGSRMENAINKDRFPVEYLEKGYMKFLYPKNVGKRPTNDDETSEAREGVALDGGAFVGVEIDAEKMVGKLNFYAAGMFYKENGEKVPIDKWHKFEQKIKLMPREIDKDENDNICNEFLEFVDADEMKDDEHFKKDDKEQIQAKLGKYFCKNMKENEKNEQNHPKEINYKFNWTTVDNVQFYAEKTMGEMREKFGITYKKLAESFLSDDLTDLGINGKSKSKFYRTEDKMFLLKQIPKAEETEIIDKLENYFDHMMEMGDKSLTSKIFLVFRVEIENTPTLFLLMENVFKNDKDLQNFDVKDVFSHQTKLVRNVGKMNPKKVDQ